MGTKSLVDALMVMFETAKQRGILVDGVAFFPAYGGMVKNSYILGISAPSLDNQECYDKIDLFIDLLHELVPSHERRKIDRIRVYNSKSELEAHAKCGFDEDYCDVCERPMQMRSEFLTLEAA